MLVDNGQETGKVHIAMVGLVQEKSEGPLLELMFQEQKGSRPFQDRVKLLIERLTVNAVTFSLDLDAALTIRKIPETFELSQNYPNPFNPQTQIRFGLPEPTRVRLDIYNVLGQRVRTLMDEEMEAGYHTLMWDGRVSGGSLAASGIYMYRLHTAAGFTDVKRMMLIK